MLAPALGPAFLLPVPKMTTQQLFVPPGVQARLFLRFGHIPRQAPLDIMERINALWLRRNQADESELQEIDSAMFELASLCQR